MDKRNLIIVAIIFLVVKSSLLNAQNYNNLDCIVLQNGDTLFGEVEYINEDAINRGFYKKIRLIDKDGKRRKYARKRIIAFRKDNYSYERFFLSQPNEKITLVNPRYDIDPENGELYFLKIISLGTLSHYELEWFEQGDAMLMSMALLAMKGDFHFVRAEQGLLGLKRKVLIQYFSNCPRMQELLRTKSLHDVDDVVKAYRAVCLD